MNIQAKRRYKIVSPVRFFCFILISVMISAMAVYAAIDSRNSVSAASADTYRDITVRDNDTLWTIADEFGPDDTDIRIIVNDICDVNGISAEDIHPGDTLRVPATM